MKRSLPFTQDDIKKGEAKLKQGHPELFKRKKVTGNTRNVAVREMLIPHFGTQIKVRKATMLKPIQRGMSGVGKEDRS
jgi:hypothetical protein